VHTQVLVEAAQVVSRRETRVAKLDKSTGAIGLNLTRLQIYILLVVI
jgi:hypothetical protein